MQAKVWNHAVWINECDNDNLLDFFTNALKESGFNVLEFVDHKFKPQGWTALWLLSESHLAIHTFPERGKSYVEITSCMLPHFQKFIELLHKKYE